MFSNAYEIMQFIIGIFGSLLTILCFLPQCVKTLKTRDTSGLSHWFLIIAISSSFFWLAIGSMTIGSPFYYHTATKISIASAVASGLPLIITNVVTLGINGTILYIKLKNMKQAKLANISEHEYCYSKNKQ